MTGPLNILVLSPVPIDTLRHGIGLRIHHLLRHLGRAHAITLVNLREGDGARGATEDFGIRVIECEQSAAPRGAGRPSGVAGLRHLIRLRSPFRDSEAMRRAVQEQFASRRFDVVLAFHPALLHYALLSPDTPVVADLVDEPALGTWRELRLARSSGQALRLVKLIAELVIYERALCPRARACLVVAEGDARSLRRLVPAARVEVLPNGVDLDYFRPAGGAPEPDTLMFSGNMDFPPNVAGVLHFHRHIFPLVKQARPEVRWQIVGANPAPAVAALAADPRVTVTGFVDDVRDYFGRAAVVLSPLVSGGGIKNKVLEAWAMGKAVVATPLGVSGLKVRDGEDAIVTADPREFAAQTVELLRQPERAAALGRAWRQTVCDHYSWGAQAARLEALLRDAATLKGAPATVQIGAH